MGKCVWETAGWDKGINSIANYETNGTYYEFLINPTNGKAWIITNFHEVEGVRHINIFRDRDKVRNLAGSNFIRNGAYTIISAANEKVFDVTSANKDNGANIGVWEYNAQQNQEFEIDFDNSGFFTLKCVYSNKYVTISGNSKDDLANVIQWEATPGAANNFRLEQVENTDMFMIVCNNSKKVLTVDPVSGNVVQMSVPSKNDNIYSNLNKFWRFSQRVSFKNSLSGKMLDVPNGSDMNGLNIIIYESNNGKPQAFDLIPIVNSEEYYIRSVASRKYLGVSNNNYSVGSGIEQNEFMGQSSQRFSLNPITEYTYRLSPGNTNVVGVRDNSTNNGAQVVLASDQINNCLNWEMISYNPKSAGKQVKEEIKDAAVEVKDKIKDTGKKVKDKIKKLFK